MPVTQKAASFNDISVPHYKVTCLIKKGRARRPRLSKWPHLKQIHLLLCVSLHTHTHTHTRSSFCTDPQPYRSCVDAIFR